MTVTKIFDMFDIQAKKSPPIESTKPGFDDPGFDIDSAMNETGIFIIADQTIYDKGSVMSSLPYYFHTPTPRFFRDNGFFKNPFCLAFVSWCFERCSSKEHEVFHDHQKILLQPYQFIFGRRVCADETGLTENQVRTQQKFLENLGFIRKTTNKTPNRFTVYEWVLEAFCKRDHQQKSQQTTNKPPTNHQQNHHNLDIKINRSTDEKKNASLAQTASPLRKKIDPLVFSFEENKFIGITESDKEAWRIAYPGIGVQQEIVKAEQWVLANPTKSKKLWRKFLTGWLQRGSDAAVNKAAALDQRRVATESIAWEQTNRDSFFQWKKNDPISLKHMEYRNGFVFNQRNGKEISIKMNPEVFLPTFCAIAEVKFHG